MKNAGFFFVLLLAMAAACSDRLAEEVPGKRPSPQRPSPVLLSEADAQTRFAAGLSQAIYNRADLRDFIKARSLRQFDKDFDVFYPLVKNEKTARGVTFREILLGYIPEAELAAIELALPLLTIYVPDLSLFTDITPYNWDTQDDEVPVAVKNDRKGCSLFLNGDYIEDMEADDIPGYHLLLVKNNERVVQRSTRSSDSFLDGYAFTDKAFDGLTPESVVPSLQTRSFEPDDEDWIPKDKMDPVIIKAWNTMRANPSLQRDNVYYGLTPTKTEGAMNQNIDEYIYRFQIDPAAYFKIADQKGTGNKKDDPMIKDETLTNKKTELSFSEIVRRLWTDGNFEIYVKVYTGVENIVNLVPDEYRYNVKPEELFEIVIDKSRRHPTKFRHTKYYYRIDPYKLGKKWYYPRDYSRNCRLPKWDISTQSLERFFYVYEFDEDEIFKTTISKVTTFTHNFKSSADGSIGGIKLGLGYDSMQSTQTSSTLEVQTTKTSDPLGTLFVYFYDAVIVEENAVKGYHPKNVANGTVSLTIMPLTDAFTKANGF